MDKATREQLEKYIMVGNHAESARFIIDTIGDQMIEDIKDDFLKIPINFNYQNIDNTPVFMLQLKAEVIKEIKKLVKSYIAKGIEARKKLNGEL